MMNGGFNFKVIGLVKEFCIHRFIDSHTAFDEKNIYSLKTAILHKSVSILHNIDCTLAKNTRQIFCIFTRLVWVWINNFVLVVM